MVSRDKGGSGTDIFTRRLADALRRHGIAAEVTYFHTRYEFAPFLLRSGPPPLPSKAQRNPSTTPAIGFRP